MLGILLAGIIGTTVMQPLDYGFEYSPVVEEQRITHTGYSPDDDRQLMVQKAYELGGLDFVLMLECESGFNPNAKGDSGRSYGLCQMNSRWHKIPQEYYNSWDYQIDYCYRKRKGGTKFYGPNRRINGQLCKDYVLDRFVVK